MGETKLKNARQASHKEISDEMDRRGRVIEDLEGQRSECLAHIRRFRSAMRQAISACKSGDAGLAETILENVLEVR